MKKVIMLLTNEFLPDVRVYKEAKHLISRGFLVDILCWQRDLRYDFPEEETLNGIVIKRYRIPSVAGSGRKQLGAFLSYIRSCRVYLKDHPCDYLHCNDIDGAIAGYLARKKRTPMVFDMHEFYEKGSARKRMLWRRLTVFLLRRSVAGLYENAAYLEEPYRSVRGKLYPLRNYPDIDLIQPLPKTESDCFRIGYHGAVRSQVPFFSALFEAVKDMEDVRVDINGEGPDNPKLKELEKKYSNVFVHGAFDGTKVLSELYAGTDVLFCGYDAGNPNFQGDAEVVKFYEAIFTGTPFIMTDGIGMAEKVRKNGYGIVCNTADARSIREAVIKLKTDRQFWELCSKNEKRNANRYSWNEAVKVLDRIYR